MLELKNVTYQYSSGRKNKKFAINNLSLQFNMNTFYTIFGPSGSGKTTCLSLLGGLDRPNAGKVLLDGETIENISGNLYRKKYVSFVFQDFHLFMHMTAMENVLIALKISNPKMGKLDMIKKANDTLRILGLEEQEINRKVSKLSGGQMQRVAIARALAVDAPYILADEPTGNLDCANTDNIISILRDLVDKFGKCVIVVTHSLKVRDASDISYVIEDGKLSETIVLQNQKV